ncbi:hypothetical protein NC652_014542 [Populus alba x Populus x berolinensis]|nr:hypothetical protein NC652_014542 [Populus alba x Populus x berolinensis]
MFCSIRGRKGVSSMLAFMSKYRSMVCMPLETEMHGATDMEGGGNEWRVQNMEAGGELLAALHRRHSNLLILE